MTNIHGPARFREDPNGCGSKFAAVVIHLANISYSSEGRVGVGCVEPARECPVRNYRRMILGWPLFYPFPSPEDTIEGHKLHPVLLRQ